MRAVKKKIEQNKAKRRAKKAMKSRLLDMSAIDGVSDNGGARGGFLSDDDANLPMFGGLLNNTMPESFENPAN